LLLLLRDLVLVLPFSLCPLVVCSVDVNRKGEKAKSEWRLCNTDEDRDDNDEDRDDRETAESRSPLARRRRCVCAKDMRSTL
jgi:hypothetical protein